ncbi:MAG TPA: rod shape-determining protein MreC [Candidatus Binataceae bacterium]|nr:rod shape-determining protein MreC [Candidatus Binataceae bacterium]
MLTSGLLLLVALHFLSAGLRPDSRANKPSLMLMEAARPFLVIQSQLADEGGSFLRNYFDLVGVRQENLRLKQQLEQYQSQHRRMLELEAENRHLADLLDLREALGTSAVAANVIGADATGLARTLILSEGSRQGLQRGMAVIAVDGVVGKLLAVSNDASRVLLINDHNSALDAFDQRSRARGIIAGIVDDGLTMKYVDRSEDIKSGDTIITSGMDGIFPRGLLVGTVARVSQQRPGLFLNVEVRAAVNFRELEQVLILTARTPAPAIPSSG